MYGVSANETGPYNVYAGYDKDGNPAYVCITKRDAYKRFREHERSGTERSDLSFKTFLEKTSLRNARYNEQMKINIYKIKKMVDNCIIKFITVR